MTACLSGGTGHEAWRPLSQILAGAEISTSTCDSAWKMVEECNDTDQVKAPQNANDLLDCNGVLDHSDQGPRASGQCDPGSVMIVPTHEHCTQIYQQATVGRIAGTRRSGDASAPGHRRLSTASSTGMSTLLSQRGQPSSACATPRRRKVGITERGSQVTEAHVAPHSERHHVVPPRPMIAD